MEKNRHKKISNTKRLLREVGKRIKIGKKIFRVERKSVGYIANRYGEFYLNSIKVTDEWRDYLVLVKSRAYDYFFPKFGSDAVYLRIDSGCISGDIFGDETCDCRPALKEAMKTIGKKGSGMVIMCLGQDGRGFGTDFKLNTLTLIKEAEIGTVEAFRALSGSKAVDKRTYEGTIAIMKFFGINAVNRIVLMTNNPSKAEILKKAGFDVTLKESKHPNNNEILAKNIASKKKSGIIA